MHGEGKSSIVSRVPDSVGSPIATKAETDEEAQL
jgi:hypothetical protein